MGVRKHISQYRHGYMPYLSTVTNLFKNDVSVHLGKNSRMDAHISWFLHA